MRWGEVGWGGVRWGGVGWGGVKFLPGAMNRTHSHPSSRNIRNNREMNFCPANCDAMLKLMTCKVSGFYLLVGRGSEVVC